MLQKLKQKILSVWAKIYPIFLRLTLGFLILTGSGLLFAKTVAAATCNISGGASICNGLTISFADSQGNAIQQAKLGDTVQVTMTITDQDYITRAQGSSVTFFAGICASGSITPDCTVSTATNLFNVGGNKNEFTKTITYQIGGNLANFVNQQVTIVGATKSSVVAGENGSPAPGSTTYEISNGFSLKVLPGGSPGNPTLQIAPTGIDPSASFSGGNLTVIPEDFSITYLDGGTGIKVASFTYDCGDGNGVQTLTPNGTNLIICRYAATTPGNPKTYTGYVQAYGPTGLVVDKTPFSITLNGNEQSQGSKTNTSGGTKAPITDPLIALLNGVVGFILGLIEEVIYAVFSFLVAPMISAVLSIHPYTDTFVAVIYPGWVIIRNICNIFFIVALIIIALATLFRVESYQYKHLLTQLILAALLINFSLVVGQAVLGLADTVQAQFLPPNAGQIRTLGQRLMLNTNNIVINGFNGLTTGYNPSNPNASAQNSSFAGAVQAFFWLALSLGSFCVFCAILAFLVVRIIALWILLMISPVAYAVGVLPTTSHYREEWWGQFLKYAFFTPIMAFFLQMSAWMVGNAQNNKVLMDAANAAGLGSQAGIAAFVVSVASNLLLLVFLIAGLMVADKFSIIGASGVTDLAKKGIFLPFGAGAGVGKIGLGYAGRKWNEFTANKIRKGREVGFGRGILYAALNPVAFGKAWAKERERKTHHAQEKAEMAGLEVVQQRFDSFRTAFSKHGSRKIDQHVLQLEKKEEDESAKGLQNMSRENVAKTAAERYMLGNDEDSMARKRGVYKLAMSKGYIDDIVQLAHKTEEGRELIKQMMKIQDLKKGRDYTVDKDGTTKMIYNHDTRRALQKAMFGWDGKHLKDHAAARLITEEGETEGMNTGHLEYMTDMYFNSETGEHEYYDLKDKDGMRISDGEKNMAGAEIAKRDSRTQAKIAWHSLMSSDGSQLYKDVLAKIVKAVAENPTFMQERTSNMLVAGTTEEDDYEEDGVKKNGLNTIRTKLMEDNVLEVDDVTAKRLEAIRNTDQRAFVSMVSRFINDASPAAVDARIMEGFIVKNTTTKTDTDMKDLLKDAQRVIIKKEEAQTKAKARDKARGGTP